MLHETVQTTKSRNKMATEKQLENDKKREVALKLVTAPEHQGNSSKKLNDSHLCYFPMTKEYPRKKLNRVLICAKYVDKGKFHQVPGIGVYFEPGGKEQHLPSLRKLVLPEGFALDENSVNMFSSDTGWVVFCKDDCRTFNDMYSQIVKPGNSLAAWKSLYTTLVGWLEEEFKCKARFFDSECLAKLTPASFTKYP